MTTEKLNPKVTALLALEAMMLENPPEAYHPEVQIHQMFTQIKQILTVDKPERLLNREALQTFQSLVSEHTGGERRKGDRRREEQPVGVDRRSEDRRFAA
jgi:hypothetical protein